MENNLTVEYIYNQYECKCDNEKKCINPYNCGEKYKKEYEEYLEKLPKECEQESDEKILKDYAEFRRKSDRVWLAWY